MHTDTPRSRLIPFLSTPTGRFGPPDGRLKRFSLTPPTQIRPRKSPLEPPCEGRRKRLRCGPETAVADASASVANSMPSRRAAPTKAFSPSPKKTVRQDKTVRHGKRSVTANGPSRQTARPDEAGRRLFAALEGREFSTYVDSFHPQMWKTQEHYPQAVEKALPAPRWAASPGSACLALACRA
mgnify:CR=1 FL=1